MQNPSTTCPPGIWLIVKGFTTPSTPSEPTTDQHHLTLAGEHRALTRGRTTSQSRDHAPISLH